MADEKRHEDTLHSMTSEKAGQPPTNQDQNQGHEGLEAVIIDEESIIQGDPALAIAPKDTKDAAEEVLPTPQKPYSSFSKPKKMSIVLLATLGGMFSPFTTNIYFPALTQISQDLHTSVSKVNITITTYMIFQAIAPSFLSPIADIRGRRMAYVVGFALYIAANLGLSFNQSYVGLVLLRCLQSAGSSGLVTLQQGTIADIITSGERGQYIGITSISSIVAPSVAPIVGGALAQSLGWHWIFIFLLILSAVYMIPLVLFMPETNRRMVGDGSIQPPRWNRPLWDLLTPSRHKPPVIGDPISIAEPPQKLRWTDPFQPFLLLMREKEATIVIGVGGIIYAAFYCISSSLTVQFGRIYGVDETIQGLLFLPQAVGSIGAAITNGFVLDWNYRRYARRLGLDPKTKAQHDLVNFPIERARLQIGIPMFIFSSMCIVVYGWLLHARTNIAGPVVFLVLIGYATLAGFNTLSVLVIDLYRRKAATASAANNLVRCLLGAGGTALVNPMISAMGLGWTFTLIGLIQLFSLPLLVLTAMYGMKWRKSQAEKAAADNNDLLPTKSKE